MSSILTRFTILFNVKITNPRREFKEKFGQANHFLITTLVGLNAIEKGKITSKDETFSTSWNPKDPIASAQRARIFVLKSFLISAVEALEMYLTCLNRKPKLLKGENFLKIYSKAGQSIYEKVIGVGDEVKVDPILIGMMEILVTWRNYIAHYDIDNQIRESSWKILVEKADEIKAKFSGLDIIRLKKTWEQNNEFTFKETASLIKATQLFVEQIDGYIIQNLIIDEYVEEIVERYFENKIFLQRFKSTSKKENYLNQIIQQQLGSTDYIVTKKLIDKSIKLR